MNIILPTLINYLIYRCCINILNYPNNIAYDNGFYINHLITLFKKGSTQYIGSYSISTNFTLTSVVNNKSISCTFTIAQIWVNCIFIIMPICYLFK